MIIEFETITIFRPLLIFLIIALVGVLFFLILIKRSRRVSGFLVAVFSVLSITISALLMYRMGVLADELNGTGDPFSFFLFLVISVLSIANLAVYFIKGRSFE
ncbi:hypothetical protein [Priestia endophytica]|uniref:hypothetical protein n=1 Tax=Priestia endophytica TaxID=135735 RepID=UPI000F53B49E|nr:hypothetical protein [Priestia endophytica]RPK15305.1 hypothetical protein FH5_00740 [Priestia endophytica]